MKYLLAALTILMLIVFVTAAPLLPAGLVGQTLGIAPPPPVRPPLDTRRPNTQIGVVLHRGAAKFAPESTLPAIETAIEIGAEFVELDVRYTKDKVPVIFHDTTLGRITGIEGELAGIDFAALRELDAGAWFHEDFAGTQVPTLDEALEAALGRICVLWDTKDWPLPGTIRRFRAFVEDGGCLLITFGAFGTGADPRVPRRIVRYWPEAPLMPLVREADEIAPLLTEYPHIDTIQVLRGRLGEQLIDTAHARGLRVFTGVLLNYDNPEGMRSALDSGADLLLLDNIDILYRQIDRHANFPDFSRDVSAIYLEKAGEYQSERTNKFMESDEQ